MSAPSAMDYPSVAIITRTKNRALFLRRAIESVIHQNYTHWTHVIVNDGGDPAPVDALCAEFADAYAGRLQLIHLPESIGMQPAANHAIQHSASTLLAIHDDDDSWDPKFLETCVEFLNKEGDTSGYQGVITHTLRVWEDVLEDGTVKEVSRDPYIPLTQISLFRLGYENPFAPIAFVYRRKVYNELGGYNPAYSYAADMEFNLRFLQRYDIGVITEKLAFYHWRRTSPTEALDNTVTAKAKDHERLSNEFMNAVMRGGDNQPVELGLALNIARFAVENQWMTVANLERIRNVDAGLTLLRSYFLGDSGQNSAPLTQSLNELSNRSIRHESQLDGIYKAQVDAKAHLNSLSGQLDESLFQQRQLSVSSGGQLEGIYKAQVDAKEHLNSLSGQLDESLTQQRQISVSTGGQLEGIYKAQVDAKEHLNSLTGQLNESLIQQRQLSVSTGGQLEGIYKAQVDAKEHLNSLTGQLNESLLQQRHLLESTGGQLEGICKAQVDAKEHLNSVINSITAMSDTLSTCMRLSSEHSAQLRAINDKLTNLRTIEDTISNIHEQNKQFALEQRKIMNKLLDTTLFQVGRLKLSWKRITSKK
ncbi:MAG: glycosyltransferase [Verrucomicrobiota bacterium]|nr:glycosyltransferase [Verrucomicrobiota bacterium]